MGERNLCDCSKIRHLTDVLNVHTHRPSCQSNHREPSCVTYTKVKTICIPAVPQECLRRADALSAKGDEAGEAIGGAADHQERARVRAAAAYSRAPELSYELAIRH